MKNRFWVPILVVLWTGLPAAAADCSCMFGNCGVQTGSSVSSPMSACCHQGHENREGTCKESCCKKCQIEKTAILAISAPHFDPLRTHADASGGGMILSGTSKTRDPFTEAKGTVRDSPPGFFVEHALGTSLTLRAPPEKSLPAVTI